MAAPSRKSTDLVQVPNLLESLSPDVAGTLVTALGQFIPGYNFIADFVRHYLGIEANKILAVLGFFFGGWTFLRYLKNTILPLLWNSFTSSLILEEDDKLYEDFNKWLLNKRVFQLSRTLKLANNKAYQRRSAQGSHQYTEDLLYRQQHPGRNRILTIDKKDECTENSDGRITSIIFNSKAKDTRKPLRFEGQAQIRCFIHHGRLYFYTRDEQTKAVFPLQPSLPSITLRCLGFKNQPLKDLVAEIRHERYNDRLIYTTIHRNQGAGWTTLPSKRSRPFHTIVLSKQQKHLIIKDANEFLQPAGAQWYAEHGIPHRRGYLFSGSPGTGKSSVSYALAGLFGLDIFVISIPELSTQSNGSRELATQDLTSLFNTLPSRCIVLLEDIDCAGIERPNENYEDQEEEDYLISSNTRRRRMKHHKALTLSDLLNTIDGVAAQEGRILIMTSNEPDVLDEALTRPGRIDIHLRFGLAAAEEVRQIFIHMYSSFKNIGKEATPTTSVKNTPLTVEEACRAPSEMAAELTSQLMPVDELHKLAGVFAGQVPEGVMSPAEIQGFLLVHKSTPKEAVAEVKEWVEQQIEVKKDEASKKLETKVKKAKKAKKGAASSGTTGSPASSASEASVEEPE